MQHQWCNKINVFTLRNNGVPGMVFAFFPSATMPTESSPSAHNIRDVSWHNNAFAIATLLPGDSQAILSRRVGKISIRVSRTCVVASSSSSSSSCVVTSKQVLARTVTHKRRHSSIAYAALIPESRWRRPRRQHWRRWRIANADCCELLRRNTTDGAAKDVCRETVRRRCDSASDRSRPSVALHRLHAAPEHLQRLTPHGSTQCEKRWHRCNGLVTADERYHATRRTTLKWSLSAYIRNVLPDSWSADALKPYTAAWVFSIANRMVNYKPI